MKQSLVELVDVILQKLQDGPGALPSESGIRTWLVRQGYAKRDIDAALKLIRPRMQNMPHVQECGPGNLRQLSTGETLKMTPGAREALVRLELYELIDPLEREMILERLDHFEGEVDLPELDYLVSWVVCGNRDVGHQQTIFNALEDKGETLH